MGKEASPRGFLLHGQTKQGLVVSVTLCNKCNSAVKKWQQVVVICNFLLEGMEASDCRTDPFHRGIFLSQV